MALKNKKSKEKKDKKTNGPKPEFVWDPSDDITWHDFVGLFLSILRFFWRILKVIFLPVFWIYAENVRMIRFIRAKGEDRPMTKYEREFVEAIPVLYSLTGLVGGLIVGFFVIFQFQDVIEAFLDSLSVEFFVTIGRFFIAILIGIWTAIKWIASGLGQIISWIVNIVQVSPFIAFTTLAVIGIVITLIWIFLSEKGFFANFTTFVKKFFGWLVESPDIFRFNVQTWYRKFNHNVSAKLIGEERMATRTQVYFKRALFFTLISSIWAFISGIYVGVRESFDSDWQQVIFTAFVLFMAGIVSGFIFLIFIARFLDSLNRKKYIAPQFILEDDSVDEDALAAETKRITESKPWLREYVPKNERKSEVDEEKPWLKKEEEPTKEGKTIKETKSKKEEKTIKETKSKKE